MKTVLPKMKNITKSKIESISVWRALDKDNEMVSSGFCWFRKVTPKDKLFGRKLICLGKFKCRLSDDGESLPQYFLGENELSQNESIE